MTSFGINNENKSNSFENSKSQAHSSTHVIYLDEFQFRPKEILLKKFDSIIIKFNQGKSSHELSCDGEFHGVLLKPHRTQEYVHKFNYPGKYMIKDDIFSFMTCSITVNDDNMTSTPNSVRSGTFSLQGSFPFVVPLQDKQYASESSNNLNQYNSNDDFTSHNEKMTSDSTYESPVVKDDSFDEDDIQTIEITMQSTDSFECNQPQSTISESIDRSECNQTETIVNQQLSEPNMTNDNHRSEKLPLSTIKKDKKSKRNKRKKSEVDISKSIDKLTPLSVDNGTGIPSAPVETDSLQSNPSCKLEVNVDRVINQLPSSTSESSIQSLVEITNKPIVLSESTSKESRNKLWAILKKCPLPDPPAGSVKLDAPENKANQSKKNTSLIETRSIAQPTRPSIDSSTMKIHSKIIADEELFLITRWKSLNSLLASGMPDRRRSDKREVPIIYFDRSYPNIVHKPQ